MCLIVSPESLSVSHNVLVSPDQTVPRADPQPVTVIPRDIPPLQCPYTVCGSQEYEGLRSQRGAGHEGSFTSVDGEKEKAGAVSCVGKNAESTPVSIIFSNQSSFRLLRRFCSRQTSVDCGDFRANLCLAISPSLSLDTRFRFWLSLTCCVLFQVSFHVVSPFFP